MYSSSSFCFFLRTDLDKCFITSLEWLWTNEWNAFVCGLLSLGSRLRKPLEKPSLLLCFQLVFFSLEQETLRHLRYIYLTDFYEKRVTAPHNNKLSFMFS